MSDFHAVTSKVEEGINWRGTIQAEIGDEVHELTVRQLRDPEMEEILADINEDEIERLREEIPSDLRDEHRELQNAEELSDEEESRMAELEEEIEDEMPNLFDILSTETLGAIRQAAKWGVEPDEEDCEQALRERGHEMEEEYNIKVRKPEDVRDVLNEEWAELMDKATDFVSVTIGLQVLKETGGDEGN